MLIKANIEIDIVEFEHIGEFIPHDDPSKIAKLKFIRESTQSIDKSISYPDYNTEIIVKKKEDNVDD